MFVALQQPFADGRPFIGSDSRKLALPTFALGIDVNQSQFLRGFGLFDERRPGVPSDWPAEDVFCGAARGVRLAADALAALDDQVAAPGHFVCAFRRFLSNGEAVSRIEIGIGRRPSGARGAPMDGEQLVRFLQTCLRLPIHFRSRNATVSAELVSAGSKLARHVLNSSTRWKDAEGFEPIPWWVTPGRLLVLLEYSPHEIASLPELARPVALETEDLALHHLGFRRETRFARVWLLGIRPGANRDRLRGIRLHLLRLHCEREAVGAILRHISQGRLPLPAAKTPRTPLLGYLENAMGFLERGKVYGHDQSQLLDIAYGYDDLVTGAQRATLREELGRIYRSLAERVDREASAANAGEEPVYQLGP